MHKLLAAIAIVIQFIISSCGVPKPFQHALYLQDSVTEAEKTIQPNKVVIEPGDRLTIGITAINKEAANEFNMVSAGATAATQGYLVDSIGNVQMLQLGTIKAGGLTTVQLAAKLQQQLDSFIIGSIVTVSITNFQVSVFGEVGRAGIITVPDGKLTILDAIIQSGDLGLYGRRDNILVIRQENGKRQFGRIDVNSNRVFESPYYNLKQNDMIYVEADKTKFIQTDPRLDRSLRNLGIATTILSTVLLVISLINK